MAISFHGISRGHGDACNGSDIRCRKEAKGLEWGGWRMVSLIDAQRYKLRESTYVHGIRDDERGRKSGPGRCVYANMCITTISELTTELGRGDH